MLACCRQCCLRLLVCWFALRVQGVECLLTAVIQQLSFAIGVNSNALDSHMMLAYLAVTATQDILLLNRSSQALNMDVKVY